MSDALKTYGVRQPHVIVEQIATALGQKGPGYAVNIGANDGMSFQDPTYPLFAKGYAGIALDVALVDAIYTNLPSEDIKKVAALLTPSNCVDILRENGCPDEFDFLKIDIDGYDGLIMERLLAGGLRPRVLTVEVQPEIPPPVKFSVLYHPKFKPGGKTGFYGCSLAYATDIAMRHGYRLAQIDFVTEFTHDATYVQKELAPLAGILGEPDERAMYLNHPISIGWHFRDVGINSDAWRQKNDMEQMLIEIWGACIVASAAKHDNFVLPFTLRI